jgi:hypothetical protein
MAKLALDMHFKSSGLNRCGGAYVAVSADSVPFSGGDAN